MKSSGPDTYYWQLKTLTDGVDGKSLVGSGDELILWIGPWLFIWTPFGVSWLINEVGVIGFCLRIQVARWKCGLKRSTEGSYWSTMSARGRMAPVQDISICSLPLNKFLFEHTHTEKWIKFFKIIFRATGQLICRVDFHCAKSSAVNLIFFIALRS